MSTAIVLLHGFTGSPASWDPVVERLPSGLRVLRPALLGHGTCVDGVCTFDEEVDRIAAAIREADAKDAVLCGYSLGGRVALGLLVRHPDLFSRAVLIGAHPGLADPAERAERIAQDERWAEVIERSGIESFVVRWEHLPMFATQALLPEPVRGRQRSIRLRHGPLELAWSLRLLGLGSMPDWGSRLGDIRVPVQLVTGALDSKFSALAERMARSWGGPAELVIVPGAGHNVPLERPAAVADLLGTAP